LGSSGAVEAAGRVVGAGGRTAAGRHGQLATTTRDDVWVVRRVSVKGRSGLRGGGRDRFEVGKGQSRRRGGFVGDKGGGGAAEGGGGGWGWGRLPGVIAGAGGGWERGGVSFERPIVPGGGGEKRGS